MDDLHFRLTPFLCRQVGVQESVFLLATPATRKQTAGKKILLADFTDGELVHPVKEARAQFHRTFLVAGYAGDKLFAGEQL
jgi:hypothetical protein